ncbi:MAG: hypothetical protein ACFCUW_08950 [Kiloniellaceae bacterium]
MKYADLKRIFRLLGSQGTVAGLSASDADADQLRSLASGAKLEIPDGATRDEIVHILVRSLEKPPLKSTDELLQMTYDDLVQYFNDVSPTNDELLKIMKELNYKVGAEDRKHLRRFVARQISETALFSRVATRDTTTPPSK